MSFANTLGPLLVLLVGASAPVAGGGDTHGIPLPRVPNTTLLIDSMPPEAPAPGSMRLVRVFPELSFEAPVLLVESPDESGRLFVVELRGRVRVFDPAQPTSSSVYLDITDRVRSSLAGTGGGEEGLLGLAFDPDFAATGEFYVHYSRLANPRASVIARFRATTPGAAEVSADSEQELLVVDQDSSNHNGGMLHFGPDEMLYIHLGDGGGAGDPNQRAQDTTNLLGSILRIDVKGEPDPGIAYRVPPDNPFRNGGPAGAATRAEIWAYGLRNPWRGSFDPFTGALLVGDVGQDAWEELNVVIAGGNYGWNIREGANCYPPGTTSCNLPSAIDPIAQHPHTIGDSITGGYTYFGAAVPELHGSYIYGDYGSGRIWRMRYDPGTRRVVEQPVVIAQWQGRRLASFGQDRGGEVYALDIQGGGLYVLRPQNPAPPPGEHPVPTRLSEVPALLAAGLGQDQIAQGIFPYEPSAALWSDNARKERFIALPGLDQIGYTEVDGWNFGEDAVLIKNFKLPLDDRDPEGSQKRIETRVMTKQDGQWRGFSYEWNEAETDAILLPAGKQRRFIITGEDGEPLLYTWHYPSRTECFDCHTAVSNNALGITTKALNSDFHYPTGRDNQLRALQYASIFAGGGLPAEPAQLPRMPDYRDQTAPLHDRARAYLAANCSMCHRPGGGGPMGFDMRWETPDHATGMIDVVPDYELDIIDARRVAPGHPERSVLVSRMESLDGIIRMPPLGRGRVDDAAVDLISEWIRSLGSQKEGWMLY